MKADANKEPNHVAGSLGVNSHKQNLFLGSDLPMKSGPVAQRLEQGTHNKVFEAPGVESVFSEKGVGADCSRKV
jgi:hypothetical protein